MFNIRWDSNQIYLTFRQDLVRNFFNLDYIIWIKVRNSLYLSLIIEKIYEIINNESISKSFNHESVNNKIFNDEFNLLYDQFDSLFVNIMSFNIKLLNSWQRDDFVIFGISSISVRNVRGVNRYNDRIKNDKYFLIHSLIFISSCFLFIVLFCIVQCTQWF